MPSGNSLAGAIINEWRYASSKDTQQSANVRLVVSLNYLAGQNVFREYTLHNWKCFTLSPWLSQFPPASPNTIKPVFPGNVEDSQELCYQQQNRAVVLR